VVLGDQLSPRLSSLHDLAEGDVVLMAEVMAECTYVRHHPKKIALVLSAMRHFAASLAARGIAVDYVRLDDPANTHTLRGEVRRAAARHRIGHIIATAPGEWRVLQDMRGWHDDVEIRDDDRFLCSARSFRGWAQRTRQLRLEFFYRDMRRSHRLLLQDGDAPAGGRWNFDRENRRRLPTRLRLPEPPRFRPDAITREVLALVAARFHGHFGTLDGFALPVTAADARLALRDFVAHRLPSFGDWQDAMKAGAPFLFHALISTSLNLGLLDPLEVCRAAERAWRDGAAPLNAVEGFIRQILGWREFIRGVYWLKMPDYAAMNALGAHRRLPEFYWTGATRMRCLAQTIAQTQAHAYAHHIQRLMVTGNFALLAGLDPDAVDEWYMIVFADAYEWVEMPNTRGVALFADGGIAGSKPYAASGAYINRMSDYCGRCHYDVRDATGDRACPFNALYWDFVARHAGRFAANPRMAMPLRNLARMDPERLAAIRRRAQVVLETMERGETV
jgi:deoxyribodipyrimidine photolyase-related protein